MSAGCDNLTLEIRGLSESKVWDYENAWHWFSSPSRMNKLLAHYELYKSIIDLPGDVIELGVYKAASLIRFATYRNLLENEFSRQIIGFDIFGKFPTGKLSLDTDLAFIRDFETAGGEGLTIAEAQAVFDHKGFGNIFLRGGNIFETLPEYLLERPATRIAFLHLDMDVKEPTEFALERLYDRVVKGGVIVFDDYGSVEGETEAVDHFLSRNGLRLQKLSNYSVPSFIRKT